MENTAAKVERPWGNFQVIHHNDNSWTKALTIYGGEGLSLHYHQFRTELWFPLEAGLVGLINGGPTLDLLPARVYSVPCNVLHRIINPTPEPKRLIEVASGRLDDVDIIRVYDKYRS